MLIVWGTRTYGTVDEVPGLFRVKTQFFHLWYIPLIPMGSYLCFGEDENERGAKIPFSFKSMLMAWVRGGLVIAMIAAIIAAVLSGTEGDTGLLITNIVFGVGALIALIASYRVGFIALATPDRARYLGSYIGMSDDDLNTICSQISGMGGDAGGYSPQAARAAQYGEHQNPYQSPAPNQYPGQYAPPAPAPFDQPVHNPYARPPHNAPHNPYGNNSEQ